jgi:hypothetical protein
MVFAVFAAGVNHELSAGAQLEHRFQNRDGVGE